MQKWTYSSTSIRVLLMMRNSKFVSSFHVNISRFVELPKPFAFSITRVICTDTKLRALTEIKPKYELCKVPETAYCVTPFLKDNFNIVDNRYFKLISLTNECNLEELLKKEELKEVLSRSSFTYDVDLLHSVYYCGSVSTPVSLYSFEDINKSSLLNNLNMPRDVKELTLCSSIKESKNKSDKPTEEQLLYVIDRLTYSLLNFFEKPHDFSIYHKNIVFQNYIRRINTRGITAYIQAMYFLKLYGIIHFSKVKVEILKITHHIEDGTVRVRWRVNGLTRSQLLINLWKRKKLSQLEHETEWLDGFSIFSVDSDGLVYKHICDKLTPDSNEANLKKQDIKSKILSLLELSRRGPISLHTLISSYKSNIIPNCKRMT